MLPPIQGRKGPLEKVLNILSCPLRGAIPIATRGLVQGGVRKGLGVFLSSSVLSPFLPQGKKGSNRQVAPADIKFYLDCHYSDCMSFAGKALRDFL